MGLPYEVVEVVGFSTVKCGTKASLLRKDMLHVHPS